MKYVTWLVLIILSFVVDLLGLIVVPIALRHCDEHAEHLPWWAWPWDNDPNGINGDGVTKVSGWRGPEHANGRERQYWWRFLWLVWRNPANNFGYLLGRDPAGVFTLKTNSAAVIGDQNGAPGWMFLTCDNCWCFYAILPWSYTRCLRVAFGWKIWDQALARAQIVCVVNPFNRYSAA